MDCCAGGKTTIRAPTSSRVSKVTAQPRYTRTPTVGAVRQQNNCSVRIHHIVCLYAVSVHQEIHTVDACKYVHISTYNSKIKHTSSNLVLSHSSIQQYSEEVGSHDDDAALSLFNL